MGHITCKSMGRVFGVVRRYTHQIALVAPLSDMAEMDQI